MIIVILIKCLKALMKVVDKTRKEFGTNIRAQKTAIKSS
jgi:hypothetical protein